MKLLPWSRTAQTKLFILQSFLVLFPVLKSSKWWQYFITQLSKLLYLLFLQLSHKFEVLCDVKKGNYTKVYLKTHETAQFFFVFFLSVHFEMQYFLLSEMAATCSLRSSELLSATFSFCRIFCTRKIVKCLNCHLY